MTTNNPAPPPDEAAEFHAALAGVQPQPLTGIPGLPDGPWAIPALWAIQARMPKVQLPTNPDTEGPWHD